MKDALKAYAKSIREERRARPETTEPALAPHFHALLQTLQDHFTAWPAVTITAEYSEAGIGRPDIAIISQGRPARAYIELKAPHKSTNGSTWTSAHDRSQFVRFSDFPLWAIANFHHIRLYERSEPVAQATLIPEEALDPERSDASADRLIEAFEVGPVQDVIERLVRAEPPPVNDAEDLAEALAYSAKLVRAIVRDRLSEMEQVGEKDTPLHAVREEFRNVLYSRPEAGGYSSTDFNALFSAAFAQTLAFGLLLVREATGDPVDRNAWQRMPAEHPLMRTALRVLSQEEVAREVGAGFEVIIDTVNSFNPAILARREDGYDPILYFYENFLETFDHEARQRYGVYYTPVEVVRFMCGALDRALHTHLNTNGLRDRDVHILDPATGTGTFLIGIAERVREQVTARDGPGQAPLAMRGLAERMYGFELLVGPYAVAHFRLHHTLVAADDDPTPLPRLGVFLTDTLARPGAASTLGRLGFVSEGIQDERRDSNRVKEDQPILAIIGNPPYRRLESGENTTLVGSWMDGIWDDLKAPVRNAGWGNQLNTFPELSVAFWRWAMWKLFEAPNAPGRGVVAFITNRKFLTGKPYAGLRQMMRQRFDRIEIIDLRGDVRAGERAGLGQDSGVFNIQVGTAIVIATATGQSEDRGALAQVHYNDAWAHGQLSKPQKLKWLERGAAQGDLAGSIQVERDLLDDFRPKPFLNGDLIAIDECFQGRSGGVQTKRDHFVYAVERETLRSRIQNFVSERNQTADFSPTASKTVQKARAQPFSETSISAVAYRPLDIRYLYNHSAYLDRRRPTLQSLWGEENVGLYCMPGGTGDGPAVWCHGLMPDYHAFRGSYGGYAFPLYDRREGQGPFNLRPALIESLSAAYGHAVTPQQVFDAILCLLSAQSYTTRFAEDLEDVFPHVPFPADHAVFERAATLGTDIRALEAFQRPPQERFMRGLAISETTPRGPLTSVDWEDGSITLCADGSGLISGIPQEIWMFEISGFHPLRRWLSGREGLDIGPDFIPDLRDIAGRIAELRFHFAAADEILFQTLDRPLIRAAFHFGEED